MDISAKCSTQHGDLTYTNAVCLVLSQLLSNGSISIHSSHSGKFGHVPTHTLSQFSSLVQGMLRFTLQSIKQLLHLLAIADPQPLCFDFVFLTRLDNLLELQADRKVGALQHLDSVSSYVLSTMASSGEVVSTLQSCLNCCIELYKTGI